MAASMQELITGIYAATSSGGDPTPYLVEDVLVIGTDPDEWWEGRDTVLANLERQGETLGLPTMERGSDLRVREFGDTAWFAEHVQATFGDTTVRVRMTGVAVRQDGEWRFAQFQAAPAMEAVQL